MNGQTLEQGLVSTGRCHPHYMNLYRFFNSAKGEVWGGGDKVAPEQGLPILRVDTSEGGLYPSLKTEIFTFEGSLHQHI